MNKNKLFTRGMILVLMLVIGVVLAGCATASSIGGTSDTHGLISSAKVVAENGEEIASYSVILGLFDSGYADYAAAVSDAESSGKLVTSITKTFFVFTKVTAYAQ